jgi:hypothetical protein
MKRMKSMLLIIALLMFGASSLFANSIYSVSIDTTSIAQNGYIFMQYVPMGIADSKATVSNFSGAMPVDASLDPGLGVGGAQATGLLPGLVEFVTDYSSINIVGYNQKITFGNSLSFLLTFDEIDPNGSGTFSLGLFEDEAGSQALKNLAGADLDQAFSATLFDSGVVGDISFNNVSGTASQVPEPGTLWLLGSGFVGLLGFARNKMKK